MLIAGSQYMLEGSVLTDKFLLSKRASQNPRRKMSSWRRQAVAILTNMVDGVGEEEAVTAVEGPGRRSWPVPELTFPFLSC